MSCKNSLENISILLVEDEIKLAKLLKDAIGSNFRSFDLSHNGEDGLKVAKKLNPDIIITDITMPKMDGLEMSNKLRQEQPNIPIVILSAYSEKEYLLNAIDIGITKYLIKPFDPDELLEVLCTIADKNKNGQVMPLVAPFEYSRESGKLFRDGSIVNLTRRENNFISALIESPDYFMATNEIKKRLWDEQNISDERLRVFINRLRQKTDPELIVNIVGQGYLLNTMDNEGKK